MDWLMSLLLFAGSSVFGAKRLLRYLHYFQLEEYKSRRFLIWLWKEKAWDRKGSLIALASACLSLFYPLLVSIFGSIALAGLAWGEDDPRTTGKLKLKMTERAKRIYSIALVLYTIVNMVIAGILFGSVPQWCLSQIVLFQLIPFLLPLTSLLLRYDERQRQKGFYTEAKEILADVAPYTIGITGSYGKTSTKDALGRILQVALGPTFWPGKSVNTVMGITREIRAQLRRGYRYAVIEMGAYTEGSIQKLCALTPPNAAVITGVGMAHLDRFGSKESVYQAKSELAQAVPQEGILVCNGDNEGSRRIAQEYPKQKTLLYGFDQEKGPLDCWISSMQLAREGTYFTVVWQGKEYVGFTCLLGRAALSNAIGAFTMACALGCDPEYALGVIHHLEPVDNRLELRKDGGVTYLKDAYNSNPEGFSCALEVMASIPSQRRILMTPGMIELGPEQDDQHVRIGKKAAQVCDLALIVGETNKKALALGLHAGGLATDKVLFSHSREEAFRVLKSVLRDGDLVLIENDLTDIYESKARF